MAQRQPTGWVGWVQFAGFLLLARGVFQAFLGVMALVNSNIIVLGEQSLVAFNFTAWGWMHIVLGVILLTAAGSVFSGRVWGRLIGCIAITLSLVTNMVFLPVYPIWSIVVIALDVLMLYALLVHGDEVRS